MKAGSTGLVSSTSHVKTGSVSLTPCASSLEAGSVGFISCALADSASFSILGVGGLASSLVGSGSSSILGVGGGAFSFGLVGDERIGPGLDRRSFTLSQSGDFGVPALSRAAKSSRRPSSVRSVNVILLREEPGSVDLLELGGSMLAGVLLSTAPSADALCLVGDLTGLDGGLIVGLRDEASCDGTSVREGLEMLIARKPGSSPRDNTG